MIELKNVTYHYGKDEKRITALDNVNLTFNEGEFVAVLGANGSGKSTLARHINGLLIPSQGEVLVDGMSTRNRDELWNVRSIVGMVFQNPDNQIIATSVEEDVAFGLENLGVEPGEMRVRVHEALETVDMAGYAKHDPHLLSGGQKQRVAIAAALAVRPKYLVFDEATSMLDPNRSAEIIATIRKLNKDLGITVIHITHNADEAVEADRVIVLSEGTVVRDGLPREVFSGLCELEKVGVGAPHAALIADRLIRAGIKLPQAILTVDELVEALC